MIYYFIHISRVRTRVRKYLWFDDESGFQQSLFYSSLLLLRFFSSFFRDWRKIGRQRFADRRTRPHITTCASVYYLPVAPVRRYIAPRENESRPIPSVTHIAHKPCTKSCYTCKRPMVRDEKRIV